MNIVGELYCSDGNVNTVKDQSQYVVGFNEVDKEHVKEACVAYIDDYFGKQYFEKERGISLKDLVASATLSISYERCIPINRHSIEYDIWGPNVNNIGFKPGKGAKKVWVLDFNDDPWGNKND
ncbi:hypothetical protein J8136_10230 [Lactiplantibacillus plantarum]|uniref:hypothetical protein n=1 Tax=Lactiplantibacillus plantarum TaxID=1590 RepID=UPI001B3254E3|nr:hypothetical protein [Lactiplantibacillus plantarum]MBP5817552.1 hypothetical protein [Lactiplantibacillus plantarum]